MRTDGEVAVDRKALDVLNLSAQLWTVRTPLERDLPDTLRRLRDIGFDSVELFGFVENEDALRAGLAAAGLSAPSAHAFLVESDDPTIALAAAERLGVTTIIDPAIGDGWDDAAGIRANADRLNAIARRAVDHGLRVGYHNHFWEFEQIEGTTGLEYFAAQLDPSIVLEIDTYWAAVAGVDVPALLARLGSRVQFLHVKDGPLTREAADQLPLGQGKADLRGILAAAAHALRVVEFDEYLGDIFAGLDESVAYLRSIEVPA